MSRWDLARARSQQPARKYKPVGPVGNPYLQYECMQACPRCLDKGYHVCSCPKRVYRGMDLGVSESVSRTIEVETVAGKLTVRADPNHVGPWRFEMPPPLEPTRATIKARIDALERFRELGMLDTPGQREAVFRMLLDGDYSGFGVKP